MRSFKKIAAMIMAVAMLCSFTALGATVEITPFPEDLTSANPSVAINYTSNASQNTILVYTGNENVVYIDQIAKGATKPTLDLTGAPVETEYTVMVGGTNVDAADTETFFYGDSTPKFDVTVADPTNGSVTFDVASLDDIKSGNTVKFTFTPNFGYVLKSVTKTIGDAEPVEFSANVDGEYALVVEADTIITAVFGKEDAYTSAESYTYKDVFDLAEEEDEGLSSTGQNFASKLFFGKAAVAEGKTIKSMGMEVYKDGEGLVTKDGSIDTKFAADPAKIKNNKYGIRFYGFEKGEYSIRSYVEYEVEEGAEPDVAYGEYITFEVE